MYISQVQVLKMRKIRFNETPDRSEMVLPIKKRKRQLETDEQCEARSAKDKKKPLDRVY